MTTITCSGAAMSEPLPDTVIEPRSGWRALDFRELREYRDLLFFLVWRDLKALYAQTILGFAWALLRPAFSMIVFSVVFGRLAHMPSDGIPYPLFAYVALVPWTYFSTAFTSSAGSLLSQSHVWSKVYFPRLLVPLTPVLGGLVDFAIASLGIVALMWWYGIAPSAALLFLPLMVAMMIVTAAGIGLWLSALAVQYRDVRHASQFLAQILMFAAPVIWPVSLIQSALPAASGWIRPLYGLYPMVGVIEGFRAAILGTTSMPWDLVVAGSASAVVILVSGALYFRRREAVFADVA
jgi:lipopolysaccharide transport system permease protein